MTVFLGLLLLALIVWVLEESGLVSRRLSIGLVILALLVRFWSAA